MADNGLIAADQVMFLILAGVLFVTENLGSGSLHKPFNIYT